MDFLSHNPHFITMYRRTFKPQSKPVVGNSVLNLDESLTGLGILILCSPNEDCGMPIKHSGTYFQQPSATHPRESATFLFATAFFTNPRIFQRFQPQFVVLNFTEFVKRQVCQKRSFEKCLENTFPNFCSTFQNLRSGTINFVIVTTIEWTT